MREVKGTMNLNIQKTTFSSVLYYTLIILLLFVPYFTTMINNKLFYLTFEIICTILLIYVASTILSTCQFFKKSVAIILHTNVIITITVNIMNMFLFYEGYLTVENRIVKYVIFAILVLINMTMFLVFAVYERKNLINSLKCNLHLFLLIVIVAIILLLPLNKTYYIISSFKYLFKILYFLFLNKIINSLSAENSYQKIKEKLGNANQTILKLELAIKNLQVDNLKQQRNEIKIARLTRLYSVLRNISQLIVFSEDTQTLYEQACRIAVEDGLFALTWIGIINPDNQQVIPKAYFSDNNRIADSFKKVMSPHHCKVIDILKKDTYYIINDTTNESPLCSIDKQAIAYGCNSLAIFPIKLKEKVVGLISFYSKEKDFFKKEEIHWLTCMVDDLSFAIESMEHEKQFLATHNALLESEERFRSAFELAGIGMGLVTPNGKWIKVNRALCELVGYTEKELLSMTFNSLAYDVDDLESELKYRMAMLDGKKQSCQFEKRLLHKNGNIVWVLLNISTVYDTQLYEPLYYIVQLQNITQRKLAENALQQSRKQYKALVELLPDAVMVHHNNKCIFVNNALVKMLKFNNPNEMIGKDVSSLLYTENNQQMEELIDQLQHSKSLFECKMLCTDNTTVDVEIISGNVEYHNKPMQLSVIRNIWERKKVEELNKKAEEDRKLLQETLELDRIRNEFFANISHELKTPINVILSTIQLLNLYIKKYNTDNQKNIYSELFHLEKYLGIIKQNSNRLVRLVNNIVDSTKIDSGFMSPHLQNLNIIGIIKDVSLSVASYIESKGFTLEFHSNVEEKIMACDKDKIERIILNLLSNAVKFTNPGGKISVNIVAETEKITISVKDTGIGIPEDKLTVIFERFRQVDKSLSRNYEGSGIGLSIVKSLVEMHEGTIRAVSKPKKGSEFIIELPVKLIPESDSNDFLPDSGQRIIDRIDIEFSGIYN